MRMLHELGLQYRLALIIFILGASPLAEAQERFRVSYGGYNETATPMWVGIEKEFSRNTVSTLP